MNPKNLLRPEYVFQPGMIARRFRRAVIPARETEIVRLPWGLPLEVRPAEVVGSVIWCYGVIDLVVTEAIVRLLDPGETALDVGANIGQMTGLMALVTGAAGKVMAFEAHPGVAADLRRNIARWPDEQGAAIEVHEIAVSEGPGIVRLAAGDLWEQNRGLARVIANDASASGNVFEVPSMRLDDLVEASQIGFCKMDVEGHEPSVLQGAQRLLSGRRIRDIAFECNDYATSDIPLILREFGYSIFSLHSAMATPRMLPAQRDVRFSVRDGNNFIATLDPSRATKRFNTGGWQALRRRC
jgi:FkbM family methyltransferase